LEPFFCALKKSGTTSETALAVRPHTENERSRELNRRERQVEELLAPTVEALGCWIWGVEHLAQGKHSKLRIYIEKEGGVDVDHCAEVSRHVSDLLDVEEFSNSMYTLEVSSPGLDRILFKEEQYQASVGAQIDVRLNFPFEGKKKLTGILAGIEDRNVVVQVEEDEYLLPLENIQKARLVPVFD
jgi:ribosome maturation factor RimP